jgi:1-acyl-sn-glycerol-3-phosphate acyltransferase
MPDSRALEAHTPRPSRSAGPGLSSAVIVVYNILYWPYLVLSCAVLFWPALLVFLCTAAWDRHLRVLHRFTSLWGGHYLARAPFAGVTVEGRENAPPGPAYVFVSNHQSMVDILAVFATDLDYKWVSKVENFYAPFIGWTMILNGYIPLKRGHLPSILRMFRRCERALAKGNSVFVFPEGTRSPDGNLQSFFRGAFVLSTRNKAPIVPVVIEGTGDILGKGSTRIVPRPVLVRVLPPVDPASVSYDDRRLREVVHAQMAAELARMRGQAG